MGEWEAAQPQVQMLRACPEAVRLLDMLVRDPGPWGAVAAEEEAVELLLRLGLAHAPAGEPGKIATTRRGVELIEALDDLFGADTTGTRPRARSAARPRHRRVVCRPR